MAYLKSHSALVGCFVALATSAVACSNSTGGGDHPQTTDAEALSAIPQLDSKSLCGGVKPGQARCFAMVRTTPSGAIQPFSAPSGLVPADLQAAYKVPNGGDGMTVAIVDANDDPNAEKDLAVYRKQFGLPACTTANGCFKKVNQNGKASPLPAADSGWAGEISLDLDMVSAVCPKCKILLVEADTADMNNLGAAVNMAAQMGANVISNSYGGGEDSSITQADSQYFNHPGIMIFASSGDSGYGVSFPASGSHVIAVGGTSLTKSGSARGWAEGAWSSGGSGCSGFIAKPSFQSFYKDCKFRMEADVSAVGDPNTGLAVYDTYGGASAGATGWIVVGGTSASSPIVASIFAAANMTSVDNSWPYSNKNAFNDVTTGSNGSCSPASQCNAGAGYDGPTGIGTPIGSAFTGGGSPTPPPPSGTGGSDPGTGTGGSGAGGSNPGTGGSDPGAGGSAPTGNTCVHDICTSGKTLDPSCDPCVAQICDQDPYCCQTKWSSICVKEVASICGQSCN